MAQDSWLQELEYAKELANDTVQLIQERNAKGEGSPEVSRITSVARRKLGSLGTTLDRLKTAVESPEYQYLSENERNRRRDIVLGLRSRREQMLASIKRTWSATSSQPTQARETTETANLDHAGILALQSRIMEEQDEDLEGLESSVAGTRHIALQINEEAGLHNRLLDELDDDLDSTTARMRAAQRRLRTVLKKGASCRSQCYTLLIAFAVALVIIIVFKITSIFR